MNLRVPTRQDVETVRQWRNECLRTLRTSYLLTEEMQSDFYDKVICDRNSPHRYWSIYEGQEFVGFGGVTYIDNVNRSGEISLIIAPLKRGRGLGHTATWELLEEAFHFLNLQTVIGEVYESNEALEFWKDVIKKLDSYHTILKKRKYWSGRYWDSLWFSIDRDDFNKHMGKLFEVSSADK